MGLLELFAKKLIEKEHPGYEIADIKRFGGKIGYTIRNSITCNHYQLKGLHSYNEVMELNARTGGHAGFGYSKEFGPMAFIGAINPNCVQESGFFKRQIQSFGEYLNETECFVEQYAKEDAEQIGNYTVFGFDGLRTLNGVVEFEKIDYCYDWRYRIREKTDKKESKFNILPMSMKLSGLYDFNTARLVAFGSDEEPEGYSGDQKPIRFAIVGENQPVGIINLWTRRDDVHFRDVWGPDEEEPELQSIRFIDNCEACKIKEFTLYYFLPNQSYGERRFDIEKKDRTMYPNFNFTLPNGKDYRLQEC